MEHQNPPIAHVNTKQIFLCGDLHNLGDLKLLLQNLALTEGRGGDVRFWAPLPAAIVKQVEAANGRLVSGKNILSFMRRAYGAQLVFGGGQLARDNVSIASLTGLLLAVWSAKLGGGRLGTRGLGISAIRTPLRRLLWKAILSASAIVNLRDQASAKNLRDLLPQKPFSVNADMVFLPTSGARWLKESASLQKWIIIAPCADESEGRSIEGASLDAAVECALQKCPGAKLLIACHDPREFMDKAVALRLLERWRDRDIKVLESYELEPLVSAYKDAALVLTNRLHSLIFGLLSGAPVLPIEDGTSKVQVVAEEFALPVLSKNQETDIADYVDRAIQFDRDARAKVIHALGARAANNLSKV